MELLRRRESQEEQKTPTPQQNEGASERTPDRPVESTDQQQPRTSAGPQLSREQQMEVLRNQQLQMQERMLQSQLEIVRKLMHRDAFQPGAALASERVLDPPTASFRNQAASPTFHDYNSALAAWKPGSYRRDPSSSRGHAREGHFTATKSSLSNGQRLEASQMQQNQPTSLDVRHHTLDGAFRVPSVMSVTGKGGGESVRGSLASMRIGSLARRKAAKQLARQNYYDSRPECFGPASPSRYMRVTEAPSNAKTNPHGLGHADESLVQRRSSSYSTRRRELEDPAAREARRQRSVRRVHEIQTSRTLNPALDAKLWQSKRSFAHQVYLQDPADELRSHLTKITHKTEPVAKDDELAGSNGRGDERDEFRRTQELISANLAEISRLEQRLSARVPPQEEFPEPADPTQRKTSSKEDKGLQVVPATAPLAPGVTDERVVVDASPKVSRPHKPSQDRGTDPKTQDKSVDAWKRDGGIQTSLPSEKPTEQARSVAETYKPKKEAQQNQDNVINDFDSCVVVGNTGAPESRLESGRQRREVESRPQATLTNKQSQTLSKTVKSTAKVLSHSQTGSLQLLRERAQVSKAISQAESLIKQAN